MDLKGIAGYLNAKHSGLYRFFMRNGGGAPAQQAAKYCVLK
jgi:hypothetical protein